MSPAYKELADTQYLLQKAEERLEELEIDLENAKDYLEEVEADLSSALLFIEELEDKDVLRRDQVLEGRLADLEFEFMRTDLTKLSKIESFSMELVNYLRTVGVVRQ